MNLDDPFAVVCTSFHSRLVSIAYVAPLEMVGGGGGQVNV